MTASPRLIRRRIQSIRNTKKITKAMELVAASKMRLAVAATMASRRYAAVGWEMVTTLARRMQLHAHPLLRERTVRRALVILMTSHRGLAGGFNANIIKKTMHIFRDAEGTPDYQFIAVGRKGEDGLRRFGKTLFASFATVGDTPTMGDALPIATLVREEFLGERCDAVFLAYTDFLSAMLQKPRIRQLLPISVREIEEMLDVIPQAKNGTGDNDDDGVDRALFEPSKEEVLDRMLPRMTAVQLYQALLESAASEHAARMMAMQNASQAAGDMLDDLSLTFHQARQALITREISEIAAGTAALAI